MKRLPATGSNQLLALLDPYIPDDFINERWSARPVRGTVGKVIQRGQIHFAGHAGRMNYHALAKRGWPIGSGAVESGCRGRQCRR